MKASAPERRWQVGLTLLRRESTLGYLLVMPILICLLLLVIYPLFYAVYISLTNRTVGNEGEFVGLANYINLYGESTFKTGVINTIVLVSAVQSLKLFFGIGIAALLNQKIRARQLWRVLILLPWAMPAFVAFIVWKLLLLPYEGAVNYILLHTHLTTTYVDFLATRELAMPSVITATLWRGFPFWVISFLAAMQSVPRELYESAALDGANGWQRFLYVTIPSIRHIILVVILISTIWTANSFEGVWLMTRGGPSNATITIPVLAYYGLQNLHIGEAAATVVAMLPILTILALIIAVQLQREG